MFDVLSRMLRTGILTEPLPVPDDSLPALKVADGASENPGTRALHPPRGCRLLQWLRVGDPGA